jgi:hypothetical protein
MDDETQADVGPFAQRHEIYFEYKVNQSHDEKRIAWDEVIL